MRTQQNTEKKSRPLSWKARRFAHFYCAPACGFGCTMAMHEAAKRDGKALARSLGPTWKVRVWENMGWHYCAVSADGIWKVHANSFQNKIRSYTAFVGVMEVGGRWAESGKTPRAAIRAALKRAQDELEEITLLAKDPLK